MRWFDRLLSTVVRKVRLGFCNSYTTTTAKYYTVVRPYYYYNAVLRLASGSRTFQFFIVKNIYFFYILTRRSHKCGVGGWMTCRRRIFWLRVKQARLTPSDEWTQDWCTFAIVTTIRDLPQTGFRNSLYLCLCLSRSSHRILSFSLATYPIGTSGPFSASIERPRVPVDDASQKRLVDYCPAIAAAVRVIYHRNDISCSST
jgi:hypothetical protein